MKNMESMANPSQQPEQQRPKIEDKDIDDLLKGVEEHDVAKAREAAEKKEREMQEALGELSEKLEQVRLRQDIEHAFDSIQDKDAIAIDRQVEETLKESTTATPEANLTRMSKMDRLGDAEVKGALMDLMRSRTIDVVLENYKHDFAQSALFDQPFG